MKGNQKHGKATKHNKIQRDAMKTIRKARKAMNTCKCKAKQGKTIKHMNKSMNK